MKIMHVIPALVAGGAEVFCAQLCQELSRNAEVHLFTFYGALDDRGRTLLKELRESGVIVHANHQYYSGRKHLLALKILADLARTIRTVSPVCVHAHLFRAEVLVALCRLFASSKTRFFRTTHNTRRPAHTAKILWPLIDSAWHATVACGQSVAEEYPFVRQRERVIVIGNGVRLPDAGDSATPVRLRKKLALPLDATLLLTVGSMDLKGGRFCQRDRMFCCADWQIVRQESASG